MFEVTVLSALLYTLSFSIIYYIGLCLYVRRWIKLDFRVLAYYVSLFCVFGVSGEVLVNNIWELIFGTPLWEYHLFPAHDGDLSYFFLFIWGGLGYYRYLNDISLHNFTPQQTFKPGVIMGLEAVLLELAYNGFFFVLFSSYVFYYLPANLGPLSHISCLQVIPFYFVVGFFTARIIQLQNKIGYKRGLITTLSLYWMITFAVVFF